MAGNRGPGDYADLELVSSGFLLQIDASSDQRGLYLVLYGSIAPDWRKILGHYSCNRLQSSGFWDGTMLGILCNCSPPEGR